MLVLKGLVGLHRTVQLQLLQHYWLGPRPRAAAGRSYPTPEARGGGREDQPHIQGAVAVRAQEGLEELSHIEGQEGRR